MPTVAILILLIMVPLTVMASLIFWPKHLLLKLDKLIQRYDDHEDRPVNPWLAHLTKVTDSVLEPAAIAAYALDQRRQLRVKVPKRPGIDRVAELAQWRVPDRVALSSVIDFENVLNSANDEPTMQKVLEKHPEMLARFTWGANGVYVIPQSKLGSQHVPDFLVAAETSLGLVWTLVEIKSPTASLTIADGQHSKELRRAIQQIIDWREWLSSNSDYARRSIKENGLGLPGIRSDARAVIIISRAERSRVSDRLRMREPSDRNIEIRTYDSLIREYRTLFDSGQLNSIPLIKATKGAVDVTSPLNGCTELIDLIGRSRGGEHP